MGSGGNKGHMKNEKFIEQLKDRIFYKINKNGCLLKLWMNQVMKAITI